METGRLHGGMRRILHDDHRVVPWKNGGGKTREIATGGANAEGDDWGWRFSMAGVAQDGPFSVFPGIDRIIVVIDGNGMDLLGKDGVVLPLEPLRPVPFPGDEQYDGRLRYGPIRDLNVMTRRGLYTASADIMEGPSATNIETGPGDVLLVHVLRGDCALRSDEKIVGSVEESETLLYEGQGAIILSGADDARIAVIRISPSP